MGRALDPNEGPDPRPGPAGCRWTSSNPSDPIHWRMGCTQRARFNTPGTRTIFLTAFDPQGRTRSVNVTINIVDSPNRPPTFTPMLLTPPDFPASPPQRPLPEYLSTTPLEIKVSNPSDPEGDEPITLTWTSLPRKEATRVWHALVGCSQMQGIGDLVVSYGQRVEALLVQLGARGPARGAGELLEQVRHLMDEPGLRQVRHFLRLRNRVVHGRPVEMPMPTREQVEVAGRAAVGALERALARQRGQVYFQSPFVREPQTTATVPDEPSPEGPTGSVYRIRERDEPYEIWVGPAGVWVVAQAPEVRQKKRLEVEVALAQRFPRLQVRAARSTHGLETRLRRGRRQLSPRGIVEVVRQLVPQGNPAPASPPATPAQEAPRVRRVSLQGVPASFYVGPAGVLVVAEHSLIAHAEARRVWEDSGGAIPASPAVREPGLKEPQTYKDGVLTLRDERAIHAYLQGRCQLNRDEVDAVAGWLYNRQSPVPVLRDKSGRYSLRAGEVVEGRLQAPPRFLVERVPSAETPKNPFLSLIRSIGWRVVFLPELAAFLTLAIQQPGVLPIVGLLLLRFFALFGSDELGWKRKVRIGVGLAELGFCAVSLMEPRTAPITVLLLIGVPAVASLVSGAWPKAAR
ncbi:MAG: hypothetical protein NZ849_08890 [Meiothermus sp.]|uniref:hypothetical protein n=1 Tax=Meiothermus sp. TaxID=1955249 RepID=UPI0025F48B31|nr:hypothetical protein [Meiothermus sp.]MCS7195005.1 hypothetical protein [Meiothermus sp.]